MREVRRINGHTPVGIGVDESQDNCGGGVIDIVGCGLATEVIPKATVKHRKRRFCVVCGLLELRRLDPSGKGEDCK